MRDDIDRLETNLNRKYGGTFDDRAVRRLRETMADVLGDRLLVGLAMLDGRPVGSVLVLRWRDELYARTVGFDYGRTGPLPIYFGLLFYRLAEYARREQARTVHYATGSEQTKQSRGCRLVAQYAYIRALDPGLHRELSAALAEHREHL